MSDHLYRAVDADGHGCYFRIRVEQQGDHYQATCARVGADSQTWRPVRDAPPCPGSAVQAGDAVAPAFYGTTAEQALRRMVQVLENTYDDVQPA